MGRPGVPGIAEILSRGPADHSVAAAEAYGWATATETLGFSAAVHHFLDRVADRAEPLTSGREAVHTQRLLDRILAASGLPTEEQEGRQWASHATSGNS